MNITNSKCIKPYLHKAFLLFLSFVLLLSILISGCGERKPVITEIGNPTYTAYSEAFYNARNPWDMVVEDGILYVGSGDFDKNSGPTKIWAYDIENNKWSISKTTDDQAISKFVYLKGTLAAPGIDSTFDTWGKGNYYKLQGEEWEAYSELPDSVHTFDMCYFSNTTFFGIGTSEHGIYPVKSLKDGEKEYKDVPFYKNGKDIVAESDYSYLRVYNFYICDDELYCSLYTYNTYASDIYKFDGQKFIFISDIKSFGLKYNRFTDMFVNASVTYNGSSFFTTGHLYKTDDFNAITEIVPTNEGAVTDIILDVQNSQEKLYILTTNALKNGDYDNIIYEYNDDAEMKQIVNFTTLVPALSFAKTGNTFFVGLGKSGLNHEHVGKILKIDI